MEKKKTIIKISTCIAYKTNQQKEKNFFFNTYSKGFFSSTLKSKQRIGPHRAEYIEAIIGNLLGDGFAEKRGESTRIVLKQSAVRINYLHYLHNMMCRAGLCREQKPKIKTSIGQKGKIYYYAKFATYSFGSFNWIHSAFYAQKKDNTKTTFVKRVPLEISQLLSKRALAHWIMDDSSLYTHKERQGGLRISAESFNFQDAYVLRNALGYSFSLDCSVHRHKMKNGKEKPVIYIKAHSLPRLRELVLPYMEFSMLYKLGL